MVTVYSKIISVFDNLHLLYKIISYSSRTASGHHQHVTVIKLSFKIQHKERQTRSLTLTYSMVGSMPAASLRGKEKTLFSEHIKTFFLSCLSVCMSVSGQAPIKWDWTLTCVSLA